MQVINTINIIMSLCCFIKEKQHLNYRCATTGNSSVHPIEIEGKIGNSPLPPSVYTRYFEISITYTSDTIAAEGEVGGGDAHL